MSVLSNPYSLLKKPVLHIAAWAGILSIIFFLFHSSNDGSFSQKADQRMYWHFTMTVLLMAALFYFYSYWVIPRFLYRKKKVVFILLSVALVAVFVEGMNVYFNKMTELVPSERFIRPPLPPRNVPLPPDMPDPHGQPKPRALPYTVTLLPFLMTVIASIAFRYIADDAIREKKLKEEKLAAVSSELMFLKSQISPHFLFNVLNNFTYLARINSALLEPSLIQLSSLLRYMLYDTNEEKVLLDIEIKYLEAYIGLQQVRHQELTTNTCFVNEQDNLTIAPMLLIPFVENAFKHASGFINDNSFITIELTTSDSTLFFKVSNKYTSTEIEQKDAASGIGLLNVQKRLKLLYPDMHRLAVEKHENIFTVSLQINLA